MKKLLKRLLCLHLDTRLVSIDLIEGTRIERCNKCNAKVRRI